MLQADSQAQAGRAIMASRKHTKAGELPAAVALKLQARVYMPDSERMHCLGILTKHLPINTIPFIARVLCSTRAQERS